MHESIRPFTMKGICADEADIVLNKHEQVKWLEDEMRDYGYVPVLDLDPQYNQSYNAEENCFNFKLTIYGTYVGKDEAWQVVGMMHGIRILKSTPLSK